jgi:hypothetical protein
MQYSCFLQVHVALHVLRGMPKQSLPLPRFHDVKAFQAAMFPGWQPARKFPLQCCCGQPWRTSGHFAVLAAVVCSAVPSVETLHCHQANRVTPAFARMLALACCQLQEAACQRTAVATLYGAVCLCAALEVHVETGCCAATLCCLQLLPM